jgi:3-methylfumaryl-CoA hydratase
VTEPDALHAVVEAGGAWRQDLEVVERDADPDRLMMLAELLGGPAPGTTVPPLWTTVLTTTWPPYDELGADGHPVSGIGLPPLPARRRLFAGGRLRCTGTLAVGEAVIRRTRVTAARVAEGRSGALLFVTVQHTFGGRNGQTVAVEEQDLAYRSGAVTQPPGSQPPGSQPTAAASAPSADGSADLTCTPDAVALFRFSSLTGNSHRIHYDEAYAVDAEGLPGRLLHGPLLALLLLESPRRIRPERRVSELSYRITRPVPLGSTVEVRHAEQDADRWTLSATVAGTSCAGGEVVFVNGS